MVSEEITIFCDVQLKNEGDKDLKMILETSKNKKVTL